MEKVSQSTAKNDDPVSSGSKEQRVLLKQHFDRANFKHLLIVTLASIPLTSLLIFAFIIIFVRIAAYF